MNTTPTRLLGLLVVLVLVLSACGDDFADPVTTTLDTATTTSQAGPATSAVVTPSTSVQGIDAGSAEDEIAALIPIVEQVRGLEFLEIPTVTVLSADELAERIRSDIEEELDPAELAADEALYELLGMLDGSVDLGAALTDLYAEQIGGFYDPETGELVVLGTDQMTPFTRMIIVHELIHAVTDQHFGFSDLLEEMVDEERYHEAVALQSLVEGDATYFQIVYMQELPMNDQLAIASELFAADTSVSDALPAWFTADLSFPYDTGFGFVSRLVAEGGIAAVDQAYRLIPETVEQVMHPAKYFSLEPGRPVTLPETSLAGYDTHIEGTFGEWNLQLLIDDAVGIGQGSIAAGGWGGDAYRVLWSGSEVAFVLWFEGDTPRDAQELETALIAAADAQMAVGAGLGNGELGSTTFSGADYAFVQRSGSEVLFVAASDPVAGAALVEAVRLPSLSES